MPIVNPGEVWMTDFGLAAKVRPALVLTSNPSALCGNRWELSIPKPFLKPGAFHLQQIQTVSTVKLERRLGMLTDQEMSRVRDVLAERLRLY